MLWTLEKKAELYRLEKLGCDSCEIADRMNLPHHVVVRQIERSEKPGKDKPIKPKPAVGIARHVASKALDNPIREPYIYPSTAYGCSGLEYGVPKGLSGIVNGDFDWD